jgi:hypothetical protein
MKWWYKDLFEELYNKSIGFIHAHKERVKPSRKQISVSGNLEHNILFLKINDTDKLQLTDII